MSGSKPFYAPAIPKRSWLSFQSSDELGRGPSLGSGPNFDTVTVIAAVAGVGAALGAKWTDSPAKEILTVIGVASVGFAVFRAFFDVDAQASSTKKVTVTDKSMPIAATPAYGKVAGSFTSPSPGSTVQDQRGFFSTQATYPATILLSNGSSESVPFYYRIVATEKPSYFQGYDTQNPPNNGEVTQALITLGPGEPRSINLVLPVLSSAFSDQAQVTLTLQKKQAALADWETLSTVTFILK
jgi:hypothetical protein